MIILVLATVALIVFWTIEYLRHCRNVAMIPVRIHVNGTRGKSSVTRLIASGLRAGGVSSIGKTTGTLPRIIFEDGAEASIERLQHANIIEQKYVFRFCASRRPRAIVIECMAVNPIYQWVTERMFVKSTISVMTNVRMDHLDQMGNTIDQIAHSLSNSIPRDGILFTAEHEQLPILRDVATKRGTKVFETFGDKVSDDEIRNFSYIEHHDNVSLALAVCEYLGVSRRDALKGMQAATPDPGALRKHRVLDRDKVIVFYNVFAANDPGSTRFIWDKITSMLDGQQRMIMLNSRADRYFRSLQLLEVCSKLSLDYLVLTGERTVQLAAAAKEAGCPPDKLIILSEIEPSEVYARIWELTRGESHVVGIGNMAGTRKYGGQIANYFNKMSEGGTSG
ncbi:MAG: poly-gamma-glutamate synthase PgsB [Candidatus Cloacimonetes bacterium]|nr:poly-gamma-glutamate synthase PgsB [Candidatus Cloacimonadota bacterium]